MRVHSRQRLTHNRNDIEIAQRKVCESLRYMNLSLKVHKVLLLRGLGRVVVGALARTPSAVVKRVVQWSIDSLIVQRFGCFIIVT